MIIIILFYKVLKLYQAGETNDGNNLSNYKYKIFHLSHLAYNRFIQLKKTTNK